MPTLVGRTSQRVHALETRSGDGDGGADHIGTYDKAEQSYRKWRKTCGGHLFTEHPGFGLTDVYAPVIADFAYESSAHLHYAESRLPIKDGLPKLRDLPLEMGGSGLSVPE